MLEIQLSRNLRKSILQGHPWVFKDAIYPPKSKVSAQSCRLLDNKGKFLAWAFYDPNGPLAIRVLSVEKTQPKKRDFEQRFLKAWKLRQQILDSQTNVYRLFNGEGDHLPGLICDIYGQVAVLQVDGPIMQLLWNLNEIATWLLGNLSLETIIYKPRSGQNEDLQTWGTPLRNSIIETKENGIVFPVDMYKGQKTGFFIDQRENRQYIKPFCTEKKVLNIFSYTGGFSIYAGSAKAQHVTSLDISKSALEFAQKGWELNGFLPKNHNIICADAFDFIQNTHEKWDVVIVDPPSMTHGHRHKELAVKKYTEIFSQAAKLVSPGGHLFLSSCSGHIHFEDFREIVLDSVSKARRTAQVLHVSGQGPDHPYPHALEEFRYLKFYHLILS